MKKILSGIFIISIILTLLTACFPTNNDNSKGSTITFYLTDSPKTDIQKAELNVKEIKYTSDSTEIILLSNQKEDFLKLDGVLEKIKDIEVINESALKNAKIEITLDSTIDIGSKKISVDSTNITLNLDTSEFNLNRNYNIIIDLDLGISLSGDTKFNPYFRTWMVADTSADYLTLYGYVYDDKITKVPKSHYMVLITDTNYSTILYTTLTNNDGMYKFNRIKLDLTKNYEISVAYPEMDFNDVNIVNFESYIITDSSTNLDVTKEQIDLYIGYQ
ncbi:hypothetical protein [Marinitoga aeolica]|uniref:DUF4382 domain-containing protein n=1 Tax=Marinitoga aeolica TaxID=2809031 RepID=A0ABY8PTC8_9BACT|nr:hypothetical protein [Marinitoga aeolica]WGS65877.1 hypothetical protein JRV97_04820 [Marinitoga aeolica]